MIAGSAIGSEAEPAVQKLLLPGLVVARRQMTRPDWTMQATGCRIVPGRDAPGARHAGAWTGRRTVRRWFRSR